MCVALRRAAQRPLGRAGRRPARTRLPRAAPQPRARPSTGCASTTGAGASGCSATRRAARRSSPTSARSGPRPSGSRAGRSTRSTRSSSAALAEDPRRARHRVPGQRQDDAALPPAGAPGHGRDGGDRERARRGRHRPPPAAPGRRAHGAARERLPVLRAARRPRRRAARPARPPRRAARSRAFRRVVVETTGLANPAPIVYTLLSEPLVKHHYRLEARGHDRRRAARAPPPRVGDPGGGRRPARGHEDGPRRPGARDGRGCGG